MRQIYMCAACRHRALVSSHMCKTRKIEVLQSSPPAHRRGGQYCVFDYIVVVPSSFSFKHQKPYMISECTFIKCVYISYLYMYLLYIQLDEFQRTRHIILQGEQRANRRNVRHSWPRSNIYIDCILLLWLALGDLFLLCGCCLAWFANERNTHNPSNRNRKTK